MSLMHWKITLGYDSNYNVKVAQWQLFLSELFVVLLELHRIKFLRKNITFISRAIPI